MPRKSLTTNKINTIKKLLLDGKTSFEISELLKISSATVSNYRASFKKQGMSFPDNRGRKRKNNLKNQTSEVSTGIKNKSFTYVINGTRVSFNHPPKSLLISKHRMLVEF